MREMKSTATPDLIRPSALRASLGIERYRQMDPLRRALLTPDLRPATWPPPERRLRIAVPPPPESIELLPGDVVSGAPAARRICEAYHRALGELLKRGRRQRVGLAFFVAAVAVTGAALFVERRLDETLMRMTVAAPALLAVAGLGVLATLGMRDSRRLACLQGERMVRGIDRGSTLAPARVHAFLSRYPNAAAAFLACYQAWRRLSPTEA